jgi:2,3-dihydro-2,3-dihydroxybenzoate dehydrogenase
MQSGLEHGARGRVAVVTGAAGGIGEAVAWRLASCGHALALVDVAPAVVDLAARLQADGARARAWRASVSDWAAMADVVASVEGELGPVEVLVNGAGTLRAGAATDLVADTWAETMAVNCGGVAAASVAVARAMVPRRKGCIVTISSNAGAVPRVGMAAYGASKAASTMFTKVLGLELAGSGIRCNVVSPGSTDTPMLRSLLADGDELDVVVRGSFADHKLGIPLGRVAASADIADAVAFLVSDQARHVTLHDLRVDGGATLGA